MVVPFPPRARQENSLFFKTSRSALGPIHTPTEGLAVFLSPEIKRLKQESDHSLHFLQRLRISGAISPPRPPRRMPSWILWGQFDFTVQGGTSKHEESVNNGYTDRQTDIHRSLLLCYWELLYTL
jgi:hypothetical protein